MLKVTTTGQLGSLTDHQVGFPTALQKLFRAIDYINSSDHVADFGPAAMQYAPGRLECGHSAHGYSIAIETDDGEGARLLEQIWTAYVYLLDNNQTQTATDVASLVLLVYPDSGYYYDEHRDELEQIRGREGLLAQVVVKAAAGENVLGMFLDSER